MSEIRVDTISEKTSANGVSIDGLTIKDGGITATTGAIVFNEAGADLDFRVESDDNVNMLFVDGGNDRVGVGTGTPSSALEIVGASSVPQLTVRSNNATAANNAGLLLYNTDSATAASRKVELVLDADGANGSGTDYLLIKKTGNNGDVEIKNSSNANLIFGTNNTERMRIKNDGKVGIGTNAPDMLLDVTGAISAGAGTDEDLQQWNIGSDNVKAKMTYLDASANRGFAVGTSTQHDFFLRTNNNIGLKVDINGAVTKPLQPAFLGVNSAQQSDIADGHVLIDIDTEIFDQNADFNTGTHTFTAPVTGKYAFMVNVTVSDLATNYQWVYAYIGTSNRTAFVSTIDPRSLATASGYSLGGSILIDMDANDTALLYFRSSAHGDNTVNIVSAGTTNAETYFSGYLVA